MNKKSDHKTLFKLPKNTSRLLPPLLYPAKTKTEEAWLTGLKKKKLIRKIGPRLYTSVPKVQEKNWCEVSGHKL